MEVILTFYSETENGEAFLFNTETSEETVIIEEVIIEAQTTE